ncbi:MAG: hypothetical protein ACMUIP_09670 [bacterium]
MKHKYYNKLIIFLLAFIALGIIAHGNVSAQFFYPLYPAPFFLFPYRSAAVVTGGTTAVVDGIWNGIWLSFDKFNGGILDMTLLTDPLTGAITGTLSLLYNNLIPIPINVSGAFLPLSTTTFELKGSYLDIVSGELYTLTMTCNLIAPDIVNGNYSIVSLKSIDFGTFYAKLLI